MERIADLIYKKIIEGLNAEENAELNTLIDGRPDLEKIVKRLEDPEYIARQLKLRSSIKWKRQAQDIRRRLGIGRKKRILWYTTAVAVSIVIIFTVAFSLINEKILTKANQYSESAKIKESQTIHPGITEAFVSTSSGERATLTTADTAKISLEYPILKKGNGSMKETTAISQPLVLDVPRGREFKIILEDSTEVWLNSESQLHYPEHFPSHERRVRVKGEVYFSVKKDKTRPFYVEVNQQRIRVYGTKFNVRSYNDESITYTTLESGSIAISDATSRGGELFLSPGNQALYNTVSGEIQMRSVDPKVIASWRNGRFVFEEQPLKAIMRDLARWYDFRYEFEDPSLAEIVFMGSVPRYADFTTAISILEKSGGIQFDIKGKNVRIHRKKRDSRSSRKL